MFTMKDVVDQADILFMPDGKLARVHDIVIRPILGIDCYVLDRHGFEVLVPLGAPVDISDSPRIVVECWQLNGQVKTDLKFEAHVLNPVGHILRERQIHA